MATPTIVVIGCGAPSRFSPTIPGFGVGGHAVKIASEKGYNVRAVARNPDKYAQYYKDMPNVTMCKGDVKDAASIAECVKDATCCLFAAQSNDNVSVYDIDRDGLLIVAKECLKANCKLVVISSVYVSPKHYLNPLRFFFNRVVKWSMMDAKWEGEQAIRKLQGLKYTIIRPPRLTNDPELRNAYQVTQGDNFWIGLRKIPKVDVAKVAVAACVDPATDNTTFEVADSSSKLPQTTIGIFGKLKKV